MLSVLAVLGILTGGTLSVQSYCDAKKQEAIDKAAEASDQIYREDQMRIDSLQIQLEKLQKKYNELNDKAYLDAEKVKWLEDDYNKLLTEYNNLKGVSEQSQNTEVSQGKGQNVETIASAQGTAHRFEATAYEPGGLTAIGDPAEPGVIAVDPNVIPLGTYVYVEFDGRSDLNGVYKASDVGGAVKGNIIDVCMYGNLSAFGRRGCTVWY